MTKKILVVEDDATTADYIAKGLVESGYVVDRAADGRDGLFHALDGTYAAVSICASVTKANSLPMATPPRPKSTGGRYFARSCEGPPNVLDGLSTLGCTRGDREVTDS